MKMPIFFASIIAANKRGAMLFALIFILLNFISATLALSPVFRQSGWPVNHEGAAFALRTIYYAEAIKSGDMVPIWCPEENHGLGSPMLLFYPRLFSMAAASILLLTGAVKFSLCLAIIIFSVAGAYGIFMVCRELSLNRWQALVFSLIFPHLNYAQMDFLVRGAMAEYSAMCLLPFLAWWCLRLLNRQEFNWSIVGLLILCGLAHSGIAISGLFMLAFAGMIAFAVYREKRKMFLCRAGISLIIIAISATPYILLLLSFKKYFNFSMYNIFLPWNWYLSWTCYLVGDESSRNFLGGFSPRLDLMFLAGTLLLSAFALIFNRSRLRALFQLQSHPLVCCGIFIFLSLLFYLWLQSPFSEWFYRYCPCMVLLQFPFRLLSFIAILLVAAYVCCLQLLDQRLNRKTVWLLVVIPCAGTLVSSQVYPPPNRGWIDRQPLEHPGAGNWPEYTPLAPQGIRAFGVWMEHISKLPVIVNSGKPKALIVKRASAVSFMTVYASAESPLEITLPAIWSKYYLIIIERNGEIHKLPSFRRGFDPRICIQIPPGENIVTVKYPSLNTILGQFFYEWLPSSTAATMP